MLSSVIMGPIYAFISFASIGIPEYYYSWYISIITTANYTAISFILFIIIFMISIRYAEKLSNIFTVLLSLVITGITLIYFAVTPYLDLYIILTIISGALFGFTIPITLKFTARNLFIGQENRIKVISTIVIILSYILIPFLMFSFFGLVYWRTIYLVSGIIMVVFTFFIAILA
ncbi:MAG: hypothetical protein ACFFBH_14005 [Promethearchaeota archaeon]